MDGTQITIIVIGVFILASILLYNLTRPKNSFESCMSVCLDSYKLNKNITNPKGLCLQLCKSAN